MDTTFDKFKRRASDWEKRKKNFERQIHIIDGYDLYYGFYRDDENIKKNRINYDLMNGRLDTTLYSVDEGYVIDGEQLTLNKGEIPHHPIISQVARTLIGEQQGRVFRLVIEDLNDFKKSLEQEEYTKLFETYIMEKIYEPEKQRILQQSLIQLGIIDPSALSLEQQQELLQQVESQAMSAIPSDIIEYMENDYVSPINRQAQELLNWYERKFDLKKLQDRGFEHMIPTAAEYYYVNEGRDGPFIELVIPDSLSYGGPHDEVWVQNMDWAKRETWSTVTAITQKYAEILTKEHWKELEKNLEPIIGSEYYDQDFHIGNKQYMFEISRNGEKINEVFGSQDSRLKENFVNIAAAKAYIQEQFGSDAQLNDFAIRETHFTWRDKRKMYKVIREEEGDINTYYFTEDYVPRGTDLYVKEIWVDEVWEATKLGTADPIYLNIRPLPHQFKTTDDPYGVQLPYVGKKFNTYNNRSRNVSIIDLGKQFQRDIDTELTALKKDLRTNVGKVFLFLKSLKSDNMSWSDVINTAKDHNFIIVDNLKKGNLGLDPNMLKSVDMSKMSDIAQRMQLVNDLIQRLYRAMGFNEARTGTQGQYATQTNIQTQQQSSYNQTEPLFEAHREVFEKAVNRLLNISRQYYKNNPEKLKGVLSEASYAELEFGYPFWYSEFNIKVENSGAVLRQVEFLRQQLQAFIQNAMKPQDVIDLALAETKTDIIHLMKKLQRDQEKAEKAAIQRSQEQFQAELQARQAEKAEERAIMYRMHQESLENKKELADINASMIERANDIDRNSESDLIQAKKMQLEFDREELYAKLQSEKG